MQANPAEARRHAADRALAWITRHEGEIERTPDEPDGLAFLKRNGDLAATAAMLLDANGSPAARELLDRCWRRFDHGELLHGKAATLPALATTYAPFWRHGLRHPGFEQAIVAAAPTAADPVLRLLIACALSACELPSPWPLDQLLGDSVLAREPATWMITDRDAYIISHVVFFLAPCGRFPAPHARYLMRAVPAWIAQFVRAGDLDLLAELVIVSHALGSCVPPPEWQVLFDAQEADGMVPFRLAWQNREAAPRPRFLANYHSTLVALAACAVCTH